jgi:hypothetical protein
MSPRAIAIAVATAAALIGAQAASADTTDSSNWAGYAIHHSGVHFTTASGTWVQPRPTCTAGEPTYSSAWVGIGGYSESSPALEQIGTEADCTASGRTASSAWYELVPSASRAIRLTVNPGDRVRARVTVSDHDVTVSLSDLTRHRSFTRTLRASVVDTTSAEWILEAPSVCSGQFSCRTLPLADFGSAGFSAARAATTTGDSGAITGRHWTTTRIRLAAAGRHFVDNGGAGFSAAAIPSALTANGRAFTIRYEAPPTPSTPTTPAQPVQGARVAAGRLFHGTP